MNTAVRNIHADTGAVPLRCVPEHVDSGKSTQPGIIPMLVTAERGLDQPCRHPQQTNQVA